MILSNVFSVHSDVCVLHALLSHFTARSGRVALLWGWSVYCTANQDPIRDIGANTQHITFHHNAYQHS